MKSLFLLIGLVFWVSTGFAALKPSNCFMSLAANAPQEQQISLIAHLEELAAIEKAIADRQEGLAAGQSAMSVIAAQGFWHRQKNRGLLKVFKKDIKDDKKSLKSLEAKQEKLINEMKKIELEILKNDPQLKRQFAIIDHMLKTESGLMVRFVLNVKETLLLSIYLSLKVTEVATRATGNVEMASVASSTALLASSFTTLSVFMSREIKTEVDRDVAQIVGMLQALNDSDDADIDVLKKYVSTNGGVLLPELAETFLDTTNFASEGLSHLGEGDVVGTDGELMSIANIGIAGFKASKALRQMQSDSRKKNIIAKVREELQAQQDELICKFHGFCTAKLNSLRTTTF